MKHRYSLRQQFIAQFLVISLFLQSCGNFNNLPISVQEQATIGEREKSTKQLDIKYIVDKEFIGEGNHVVTFREGADQVVADVEFSAPAGFTKSYEGLAVNIDKEANLTRLPGMSKEGQKHYVHFNPPKNGQPGSVSVYRSGLKGGGSVISKSEKGTEIDKGKEKIENEPKEASKEDLELEEELEESEEGTVSQVSSQPSRQASPSAEETTPHRVRPYTYAEALEALGTNIPQAKVVDLSQEELNKNQLKKLKQVIDNNFVVGYVRWGKIPEDDDCKRMKGEIEKKLVQNICNYRYHASDYVHGLLANHVYDNPKVGDKVDLNAFCEKLKLAHKLPEDINTNWEVIQVIDDSQGSGYYSALYVNTTTHQAVLAFQGTNPKRLLRGLIQKGSDIQEDIAGVLYNNITKQQASAYKATKKAVEYVKPGGLNLSITGHSLGGYLAELAVVFCEQDFGDKVKHVKAIVFDSPGAGRKLDIFKSNVRNPSTKLDTRGLPILTYLSAPNLVNACNWHPGEVYRLYPTLNWSNWVDKWVARASRFPWVGTSIQGTNKGLLALTGHSLVTMLELFDPATGKPEEYTRVGDWPKLNTAYLGYESKAKDLAKYGTLDSIWSVIKDRNKIDQHQYWETLDHLDEAYKQCEEKDIEEFRRKYAGHYRESKLEPEYHVLQKDKFKSVDWYLYKLYTYKSKLAQRKEENIVSKVLKNILEDYEVKPISYRPYIRLLKEGLEVEALRDKIQRALDVLSATSIDQAAMGFKDMMHTLLLSEELESTAIQQLSKLHHNITEAKLKDYFPREQKQEELRKELEQGGVCVVSGHGGAGKTSLAAQYADEQKNQKKIVRWVLAETKGKQGNKLVRGYENLARKLRIDYQKLAKKWQGNPHKYHKKLSREVYNALVDCDQSVLLILDNADDPALIADCLLNKPSSVQVIITTRDGGEFKNYNSYDYGNPVELEAFTDEEAKKYIQQSLEQSLCRPNEQDIKKLIQEVTKIPQPLALAMGYIKNRRKLITTVQQYIDKLQELKRKGIKEEGELVLPEARLGIESLDVVSQQVMRYSAYLDPDFIPLSLIISLLKIDNRISMVKAR
jgi:hypothetical protein